MPLSYDGSLIQEGCETLGSSEWAALLEGQKGEELKEKKKKRRKKEK